jgi:uncharacterized SAM-binding protein YcdF (DUF218 family)
LKSRESKKPAALVLAARFLKWFFISAGVLSLLVFILSFTDIPFYAYYNLGVANAKLNGRPDVIVVLGGAGMPSPDGLIRTYYAAEAAHEFEKADIIIALPRDEQNSLHQSELMAHELILKGVDSLRIKFEAAGFNTHSQAMHIAELYGARRGNTSILIVTTPEHMYRSVKAFRKAGFVNVGGSAAFEKPVDAEQVKDKEGAKDTRVKSLALRYNMWSYLHYELLVAREYCAICYYKLKGWI